VSLEQRRFGGEQQDALEPAREAAILMRDKAADELMAEDQPTDGIEAALRRFGRMQGLLDAGEGEVGSDATIDEVLVSWLAAALREYRFRTPART
jgi:hypothetical protein